MTKKRIGVYPPTEIREHQLTFASLAELLPVVFEPFSPEKSVLPDACVFLGPGHSAAQRLGIPCYVWENKPVISRGLPSRVKFSSGTLLHKAIRSRTLVESDPRDLSFCSVQDGDTVIATVADSPVWTVRGLVHRVSVAIPHLTDTEFLYSHLVPGRWLGLLPFIQFLRHVTADIDWQVPTPKACFVIDDPNLHALTYGDLDFRQVAEAAKSRNYHVAIATVPMDAWYVNQNVARLFKEYSRYLSLAVHGSEHTKCELTEQDASQLVRLGQALRRVDLLERKAGLDVSRIMVAPHEACSERTTEVLLKLGFEGMVIKLSKLLYWVREKRWPLDFGLRNVIWMGSGFPIIRRFRLQECFTQCRLAAFLGQPIVAYGHHSDCSLDLLNSSADTINSTDANWVDLKSILRSNYRTRTLDGLMQIQMCSRHMKLRVPETVTHISVERPWMQHAEIECLLYEDGGSGLKKLLAGPVTEPFEVKPDSEITLQALPNEQVDYRELSVPRVRAWSMVRRVLVETRDRLKPVVLSAVTQSRTGQTLPEGEVSK